MGTLFKNGTVITASDMFPADVLVEGETIALIGKNISSRGHEVVNCKGKYLMPGTPLAGEHSPEEIRRIAATLTP